MRVGRRCDLTEAAKQIALLSRTQRPQKFQNLDVDQQPLRAHGASSGNPSWAHDEFLLDRRLKGIFLEKYIC
jgi:hypothetical protein